MIADIKDVGLIDKKQIVGKVMFRYWPFDKWESGFNQDISQLSINKGSLSLIKTL